MKGGRERKEKEKREEGGLGKGGQGGKRGNRDPETGRKTQRLGKNKEETHQEKEI